jgi:hypothetical protein
MELCDCSARPPAAHQYLDNEREVLRYKLFAMAVKIKVQWRGHSREFPNLKRGLSGVELPLYTRSRQESTRIAGVIGGLETLLEPWRDFSRPWAGLVLFPPMRTHH